MYCLSFHVNKPFHTGTGSAQGSGINGKLLKSNVN